MLDQPPLLTHSKVAEDPEKLTLAILLLKLYISLKKYNI